MTLTLVPSTPGTLSANGGSQPDGTNPDQAVQLDPVRLARVQVNSDTAGEDYAYDNGTDGVGATVTAAANASLVIDGVIPEVGDRVLFADSFQESTDSFGIYTVTDLGADDPGGSPWVLTRATDCDSSAEFVRYWTVTITEGDTYAGGTARVWSLGVTTGDAQTSWAITSAGSVVAGRYSTVIYPGGGDAVAIGDGTIADIDGVAIGTVAEAGSHGTAIGFQAKARADNSYALGNQAQATEANAAAVGNQAVSDIAGVTTIDGPAGVRVAMTQLGFYGTTPITKPTVSNATAADIITALAALGLITDDT